MQEWEESGVHGLLSVVIPAHNEEGHISDTVRTLAGRLAEAGIEHEILVVNDNSSDGTEEALRMLVTELATVCYVNNTVPNSFGWAVRRGLAAFRGDAVAVVMADGSDDPADVVKFYRKLQDGYDCVFGSRFCKGGTCYHYPWPKLILNRIGNLLIRTLFWMSYNDVTNAFKMYRRHVIAGLYPLLAHHFNLTVELPLKAIVRGYSYAVVPNSWYNRESGVSKFKIREMGSRYLFIILYCFLEKMLVGHDYKDLTTVRGYQLQVWPK